jgi:hypothetical protein
MQKVEFIEVGIYHWPNPRIVEDEEQVVKYFIKAGKSMHKRGLRQVKKNFFINSVRTFDCHTSYLMFVAICAGRKRQSQFPLRPYFYWSSDFQNVNPKS